VQFLSLKRIKVLAAGALTDLLPVRKFCWSKRWGLAGKREWKGDGKCEDRRGGENHTCAFILSNLGSWHVWYLFFWWTWYQLAV